jgi:ubiquinone/menaquinone biosynthesis C-methylase UbiE
MNAVMPSAFDLMAAVYDAGFTLTATGKLQRGRVHHFLRPWLANPPVHILEINCGTGDDALWLAARGHEVIATDASAEMIAVTMEKISASHLRSKITVRKSRFEELSENFRGKKFDLIFSNFGGLNCVSPPELKKLSIDFASLLKPGGKLIAVVMGQKCRWEQIYFLWKGKPEMAFRRNSTEPVQAALGKATVPTWYFSPREFEKQFEADFKKISARPVGLFIPPSYLNPFFEKRKWLLSLVHRLEKWFSFSVLSNQADHFLMAFQHEGKD